MEQIQLRNSSIKLINKINYLIIFSLLVSPDPTKHEPETQLAIRNNIQGLAQISGERTWIELNPILSSEQAAPEPSP